MKATDFIILNHKPQNTLNLFLVHRVDMNVL